MDRASARADLLAGLPGAVIVLPQCVAFAALAGLPPAYGLYCAMVPAVIAALFGSSRHLVSGPTNAISVVLFASLAALAEPGSARYIELALAVTLLCGAIQLALGLARLGALVSFISHTVIVGFMAAAAIVIVESQLHALLGIGSREQLLSHMVVGASWEGHCLENLLSCAPRGVMAYFYRTSAGAEIDLLLVWPGGEQWAIEFKRSLSPKVERGFHNACDDLKPARKWVVYPGQEAYPLAADIQAVSLHGLCETLRGAA